MVEYNVINKDSGRKRRHLGRCGCITLIVIILISYITLIVFMSYASVALTRFGTCHEEYNRVNFGHCTKWPKLSGPKIQCDMDSEFTVPYWYVTKPLCTKHYVNILTTVGVVVSFVFGIFCAKTGCGAMIV